VGKEKWNKYSIKIEMMILSRYNLNKINVPGLILPEENIFGLPEKVLQFGTGVLLRGLPDYFIDKANRNGIFNGRIVVVKSTSTGSADDFDRQDGLYTFYLKGIENAKEVNEQVVCSAISRVLSASTDWDRILQVAHGPHLQVIISNTTEIGIQLVKDDVRKHPPVSFPGKLLAILYERYKAFNGDKKRGLVIIPTELIIDNGKKLESIVLELAHLNKLEPAFMDWLEGCNSFCNSLVDRIVPGKPEEALYNELEKQSGYRDELRMIAEPYSLWAIEGDKKVASILSFSKSDKGVVITPDIELFRELKLRLLNGTHTLTCAIAFLSGFRTVKNAMDNEHFLRFIKQLMKNEIKPAIPYTIDPDTAEDFSNKVLDRFRNPFIEHKWISISVQYSTKIKTRVIPLLLNHYKQLSSVPESIAFGFAAFLRFMKIDKNAEGEYAGVINSIRYPVTDNQAHVFYEAWAKGNTAQVVKRILKDKTLWDTDLTLLPGFEDAVVSSLNRIEANGVMEMLAQAV
jgi:tagaturonate reductase